MQKLASPAFGVICRWLQKRLISGPSGLLTTSFASIIIVVIFYVNYYLNNGNNYVSKPENSNFVHILHEPNRTWMKLRKELLDKDEAKSKVLLMSYMRGGTTLFSDIFNLNSETNILWHEPMDAFYEWYAGFEPHSVPLTLLYYKNLTRRTLSNQERNEITNYLDNLLNCRPENIPMETFAHYHITYSSAFAPISTCMESKKAKFLISNCTLPLRPVCGYADLIRRDVAVALENKCPDIISALRSLLQNKSEKDSKEFSARIQENVNLLSPRSREHVFKKLLKRLSGQIDENLINDKVRLIMERQLCLVELEPSLRECTQPAFSICQTAKLSAVKSIRVMFDDVEALIQRNPDIHVIHYVRDPRAIATSRSKRIALLTMSSRDLSALRETEILCLRMSEDLKTKRRLERKYPGSIRTVRYEDFIRRPRKHVTDIFKSIARPLPTSIDAWITSKFRRDSDDGFYGTVRKDPVLTSVKWMSETTMQHAMEMENYCRDVIHELRYFTLSPDRSTVNENYLNSFSLPS